MDLVCSHCGAADFTTGLTRPGRPQAVAEPEELAWPWSGLTWPKGSVALVSGPRGSGKSSLCGVLRPDVWFSTEQEPHHVAHMLARIQRDEYSQPLIGATTTPEELFEAMDEIHVTHCLVLDSITEFGVHAGPDVLRRIIRWVQSRNARAIVVAQYLKEGRTAGAEALPHLVDIVASVDVDEYGLRRLNVSKNRFGDLWTHYFALGAEGIHRPEFTAAYSVEGSPGQYALVPYPSRTARWQDFIRAQSGGIERTASAARAADGYADGWLQPEDVAQRRGFAEAHGLRWIGPEN